MLAILTVCLLNVAAASATTPTAAPHSTIVTVVNTDSKVKQGAATLTINPDQSNVLIGGTVHLSGYLTDINGNGIVGQSGWLTYNGQNIASFKTNALGFWEAAATFHAAGTYYITTVCDGLSASTMIQVS